MRYTQRIQILSLEYLLNRFISLDSEANKYMQKLTDKNVLLYCSDYPSIKFYLSFNFGRISVSNIIPNIVHTSITAPLHGLINLVVNKDQTDIRNAALIIDGDIEAAQTVQKLLFSLDIDWEEELAKISGDVFAYQALNLLKQIRIYQIESSSNLEVMVADYLQVESNILPTQYEVQEFMHDIDELRLRVDRLEARLQLLNIRKQTHAID